MIKAIPRPITAPPNAPLTLTAAPGNSEAEGAGVEDDPLAGVLVAVPLTPPGETNWAVVATAGISMVLVAEGTPEVKGTSVPTALALGKAGVADS
jgi:hypothetical protein